ncbi:hypothetical protein [Laribacter hongkongensis]|uniref:Uncharacterized protein n=1 Tax=Laribacter hongkongensis TaxID=168471 RepID=A0A248LQ04_9NEIS|nr:hypothetical protein [Laribacter hongkongensis]ASJ26183.1 hypothetical protein LHGZ1_3352 [Laribacter hongkongensis]
MRAGWRAVTEFVVLFAGLLAYIVVGLVRESSRWLWRTLRR